MVVDHVLINVAFITSALFTPVTSLFWPWWQSTWGWNIVTLEACIAGTLLASWLFLDFGVDFQALQWITAVFLALIIVVITWRAVMIWREQRRGAVTGGEGVFSEGVFATGSRPAPATGMTETRDPDAPAG
jgi:hypothetical protein